MLKRLLGLTSSTSTHTFSYLYCHTCCSHDIYFVESVQCIINDFVHLAQRGAGLWLCLVSLVRLVQELKLLLLARCATVFFFLNPLLALKPPPSCMVYTLVRRECVHKYFDFQRVYRWMCKLKRHCDSLARMGVAHQVIHMKRFHCSARWREKIRTLVLFPHSGLDMSGFVSSNSAHRNQVSSALCKLCKMVCVFFSPFVFCFFILVLATHPTACVFSVINSAFARCFLNPPCLVHSSIAVLHQVIPFVGGFTQKFG